MQVATRQPTVPTPPPTVGTADRFGQPLPTVLYCAKPLAGCVAEQISDSVSIRIERQNKDRSLEQNILSRLADGDPTAAQDCLQQYGGLVWALARRHTPTSADAEDAVQEVFIDVWKSAARYRDTIASEATFITMIARRRLIDRRRRAQRRPQTDSLNLEIEVPNQQQQQLEASAEAGLAARALAKLDPKERHVILLSTYHGMSHSQISRKTGIPLGTVKTYIRRGLLQVKNMLSRGSNPQREAGS